MFPKRKGEVQRLGLVDPAAAVVIAFCFLAVMLYKRLNLGITLNATAVILAVLALDWQKIPETVYATTTDVFKVSVVLATFAIMLLSQLYKETRFVNRLSENLSRIIKNPKIVLSLLPAVIGLLPVAGGALMSAPLVDSEAEKLKLKPTKKAYVNLWFRHKIFPVYPLSQVVIAAASLAAVTVPSIILRQIPVVAVMVIVGYVIGFWKTPSLKTEKRDAEAKLNSSVRNFLVAFSPILASIIVVVSLGIVNPNLSTLGVDVLAATIIGLIVLVGISKPTSQVMAKSLRSWGIYGITFAAYGAFLLGKVITDSGVSKIFESLVAGGTVDVVVLLTVIPAVLGALTASALGGVLISIPILSSVVVLSPRTVSLIYMSAYLGYVISPTHLCFTFTAEYFKCHLGKIYKYVIPSFVVTFTTALLIYFFV